ncbi:SymE family type I addiction module toxin [Sessilibacter corallicola]|uniref:SymE family type I addiction module toxin n=1 Tax=Sessilibacter corallicola TaxID=2904075 RepID=UPI003312F9D7
MQAQGSKELLPLHTRRCLRQSVQKYPTVPLIQLKGYWLNEAGFTIDIELSVYVKDGCITSTSKNPTSDSSNNASHS